MGSAIRSSEGDVDETEAFNVQPSTFNVQLTKHAPLFQSDCPNDSGGDQYYAAARPGLCSAHHFHHHHAAARKQHEFDSAIEQRTERADQSYRGANGLDRS